MFHRAALSLGERLDDVRHVLSRAPLAALDVLDQKVRCRHLGGSTKVALLVVGGVDITALVPALAARKVGVVAVDVRRPGVVRVSPRPRLPCRHPQIAGTPLLVRHQGGRGDVAQRQRAAAQVRRVRGRRVGKVRVHENHVAGGEVQAYSVAGGALEARTEDVLVWIRAVGLQARLMGPGQHPQTTVARAALVHGDESADHLHGL